MPATHFRTCPLCEATCGLEVTLADDGRVERVRGDHDDVFSRGFICPKGASIGALHDDPARLRRPLVRDASGELREADWGTAFARVDELLAPLISEHGRDAVGVYLGNPSAHSLGATLYARAWLRAVGTRNIYSASTVDQMPKHVSAGLMFGHQMTVPVPDVDRCMHLVMLGANPLASNGSLLTAPDMRGRLRRLRERGGRLVVIDPRRSRTAEEADEHHFIRPGTDAHLLAAMAHVLFKEGLVAPIDPSLVAGLEDVERLVEPFSPEAVEPVCGIAAAEIRRMARDLAAAAPAAVYGRIGTTTQRFGTLASWLVDVLNVLTGNLDRPGGAMFTLAAAGAANARGGRGGRGLAHGRWTSRVRGLSEVIGELPVSTLADEIETPGEGRVRALITVAGNPARSTPNSGRLERALGTLDALVCVDIYLNETTRHADVVLPAPPPFAKAHFDLALYQFGIRNVANWSPPIMSREDGMPDEWETLLRIGAICAGMGPEADLDALDDATAAALAQASGVEPDPERRGPERLVDILLRSGPHELTLADLEANPHGIDLGPLEPRLPDVLKTPSGLIELAPEPIAGDVERLRASLAEHVNGQMVLIGRRTLRSNNSWMHNLEPLVKGPPRCTMHVHPSDAERLGLVDGETALVRSRAGAVEAPVEVTDAVMPGVVSIPHGWGHGAPGSNLPVAARYAGVNANALTDELELDPLSGNAVLNGVPVEVAPVAAPAELATAG